MVIVKPGQNRPFKTLAGHRDRIPKTGTAPLKSVRMVSQLKTKKERKYMRIGVTNYLLG